LTSHPVAQMLSRLLVSLMLAGQTLLLSFINPGISGLLSAGTQKQSGTKDHCHVQ
jgi:hypothetical protein